MRWNHERDVKPPRCELRRLTEGEVEQLRDGESFHVVEDRNPTFKGLLAGLLLVVMGTVFGTGVVTILVWAVRLVQEWVR